MLQRIKSSVSRWHVGLWLAAFAAFFLRPSAVYASDDPVKAGGRAVRTVSSPLSMTWTSWENIWKQWGLDQRPENLSEALAERYGLIPDPGSDLPLGLTETKHLFGRYLSHNCLLCHAGKIAGQTIVGLGNASFDLQTLTDDLYAGERVKVDLPFQVARGRGVIEAFASTSFLLQYRNADLSMAPKPHTFELRDYMYEDVPAWWLYRKKKTVGYTGSTDARSVRPRLMFLLPPTFSGEDIKRHLPQFRDMKKFINSLEPPAYPFEIDEALAETGRKLFVENCAECHGTYGPDGEYPNRIIPLDEIGTDPALAEYASTITDRRAEYWKKSWFSQEQGPNGEPFFDLNRDGYQAPPLDGVWATAPYFHNASVPTLWHVLNSKARPEFYTRSYRTDEADYDKQRVGWKIEVLEAPPADDLSAPERRRIVNTRAKGRSNAGHTFGDHLNDAERKAVLEYLKTI